MSAEGLTPVLVARGGIPVGVIAVADTPRQGVRDVVDLLHQQGVESLVMLTGDTAVAARALAAKIGIDDVRSDLMPEDKVTAIEELRRSHRGVAMVGDGINDAPALARADLGIAIGAGTDVAIESAGVVLASSDPRGVADTITLSRASYRKMLQNLAWATGYNAIGLPVAAGVLAGVGFLMPPAVGAAVMSISTIVVALNAQLLRRLRFSR
jgi:Cu2+-exporting ATPase